MIRLPAFVRLNLKELLSDAGTPHVLADRLDAARERAGLPHNPRERRSWETSLPQLASALEPLANQDIGVLLEYPVPGRALRTDVILTGQNRDRQDCAVVLEDKAWSSVTASPPDEVTVGGQRYRHPQRQVESYLSALERYHALVSTGQVRAFGAVFLHNLPTPLPKTTCAYEVPVFVQGQHLQMAEYLCAQIGHGEGERIAQAMDDAGAVQPPDLLTRLQRAIRGEKAYRLVGEQYRAFRYLNKAVHTSTGRQVFVVPGAVGTGKTAVALRVLGAAAKRAGQSGDPLKDHLMLIAPGGTFRYTLQAGLTAGGQFNDALNVINGPRQVRDVDLLICDEAHRVRKDAARTLLAKGRITLILLDERQVIQPGEGLTVEDIRAAAGDTPVRVLPALSEQMRCGSTAYLKWIDHLLYGDALPDDRPENELQVVDSPHDLDAFCVGDRDRVLAGFCWHWGKTGDLDVCLPAREGEWQRPWNPRALERTPAHEHPHVLWHQDAGHRHEVGCIYTAQGLEFPRCGVIWGGDLVWRGGQWVACLGPVRREKNPTLGNVDRAFAGMQDRVQDALPYLKNIYRVLLTRATQGTAVFITDAVTREHVRRAWARIA